MDNAVARHYDELAMGSLSRTERDRLVTTMAFALIAVIACAMPVQNDTWWHLRYGMETLDGQSPFVDRFSWTVTGQFFWNHSWLSQILFYLAHRAGGLALLTLLCASVVVATWAMVWRQCRGDTTERLLLLFVALPVSTLTWSVRPQVAIGLLPVVVSLVARNRLIPTALVMAAWANLHAGFVLGVLVLGAGVVAALLFDRATIGVRLRIALIGTVSTLATPMGLTNWREIAVSVGRSQANAIIEWQSPGLGGPYLVFWCTALVFALLLMARWRRLDSPYVQISALAACLALLSATRAMRNVPPFMMLVLPPLSALLFDKVSERRPPVLAARTRRGSAAQAAVVAVAVIVVARLWSHPTAGMDWHPISTAAQSAISECAPPLFNTYIQGGTLIWFVRSQPVFVDSRQDPYPVPLVQQAVAVEQRGEYRALFEARGIRCAVLPPSSPAVAGLTADGWHTRFADSRWVVLER